MLLCILHFGLPRRLNGKRICCSIRDAGDADWEDALQEGVATHSSILAWGIPWTEEPSGLHSTGSQRDMTEVTEHEDSTLCYLRRSRFSY